MHLKIRNHPALEKSSSSDQLNSKAIFFCLWLSSRSELLVAAVILGVQVSPGLEKQLLFSSYTTCHASS